MKGSATIHSLGKFRFLKRYAAVKRHAALESNEVVAGLDAQLRENVRVQTILNSHLRAKYKAEMKPPKIVP